MLRFLIADDYIHARNGLKEILNSEFHSAYIEEADNAETLILKALNNDWDLVITDLHMPGRSGLDAMKDILEKKPGLPFVFVSLHTEEQYIRVALLHGASGYLGKNAISDELADLIRKILYKS